MRWDGLRAGHGTGQPTSSVPAAQARLPLALPTAVARTFDTPGFAGTTFYEIQARSIISKVPGGSRLPFQWTVNPYRGCGHACTYCLSGDTPILMADGRVRPIASIRVGDSVYGTTLRGKYRRYVHTTVLDHWSTVKPAYRVTLADGTRLVASGEHRFLTDRGWKHVTGELSGPGRRPHLTRGNKLLGVGRLPAPPRDCAEYRRGYLYGVLRGGRIARRDDAEVLDRARTYLADLGLDAEAGLRPARGLRGVQGLAIRPASPGPDWDKGFLAGIYDADGSCGPASALRISSTDPEVLGQLQAALARFGLEFVVEETGNPSGLRYVRLRGGLAAQVRFFLTVDPAASRKRSLLGRSVKSNVPLGVVAVESLDLSIPMFDLTTGTGDFIAAGVISHNCFARNSHTYLDLDAGDDFDRQIVVKVNAGRLLRHELAAPRWRGAPIAMGTNVDCYQRAEGRYRLMRPILAALRDFANPFSILTKGTLILRDLDLLTEAAKVTEVGLAMSVGFTDERLWRSVEPGTPSPARRLAAVARLTEAGFPVGVLMAPLLPGLTDDPVSIEVTVAAIARAGAASVTPLPLHLRPGAREWYLAWLQRVRPDLLPRYRELFRDGSYSPAAYQREVTARVRAAARRFGLGATVPAAAVPAGPAQLRLL